MTPSSHAPDASAAAALEETAARFRSAGLWFQAGYTTERVAQSVVGSPRRILDLVQTALADYALCWEPGELCTPEALAALTRATGLFGHWIWPRDDSRFRVRAQELQHELARRLVRGATDSPNRAGYLVTGLVIDATLTDDPTVGIRSESGEGSPPSGSARIDIPPAFLCYLRLADYVGAQRIVDLHPELFNSPSMLGWKAVVRGHVWPDVAVEAFEEAAAHFHSELPGAPGHLSPYFQALSRLAAARRDPVRVVDFLLKATEVLPPSSSGSMPLEVIRLALLLRAFSAAAAGGTPAARGARQELQDASRLGAEDSEDPTREALARLVAERLEPFAVDPARELSGGRLVHAMEALRRLPHVPETEVSVPNHPAINLKAHDMPLLPISTGLHKTVAEVSGEELFELLLFRMIQTWAPMHAEVVHGPVRSGSNMVLLLRLDGELVLRLYRARVGVSGLMDWGEVQSELEGLFRAPVTGLPPLVGAVRRVCTLVLNFRLAEDVRSEARAWAGQQRRAFAPEAEVMDLDDFVDWIVRHRLVNDLRSALGS